MRCMGGRPLHLLGYRDRLSGVGLQAVVLYCEAAAAIAASAITAFAVAAASEKEYAWSRAHTHTRHVCTLVLTL